ncbi:MAG: SagB/ThcOx family dehydrogenase [Aquificae bacterium]|nr:SagB/ThcOx family dehydrogenase [Aquificota bacterium]
MNPIRYHLETKHHFNRLARSLGYLDWANQPEPFRFYKEAEIIKLPLDLPDPDCPYEALYETNLCKEKEFSLENISKFLELALGLSAWKSIPGSQWALRMNPSSGNLHPTEAYLIIPHLNGIEGIFHYNPYLHALEKRASLPEKISNQIKDFFGVECFFIALTSIPWREAWKYGERALRYCLLDTGHAIGSVRFSASLQGWKVKYLNALSDKDIEKILGFHKTTWIENEEEFVEGLFCVFPQFKKDISRTIPEDIINEISTLDFKGKPNRLSKEHVRWEIIYETLKRIEKPRTNEEKINLPEKPILWLKKPSLKAPAIIKKRRSAQAYDRKTYIDLDTFVHILDKTIPRKDISPFDVEIIQPSINLLLFVHRVSGLKQGLYFFFRDETFKEDLIKRTRRNFLWKKIREDAELYLLYEGNVEQTARIVSCHQDIASDSSFSLGMISLFEPVIKEKPWLYRNIHWEAGLIGQVLYLEAEAQGIRGTGIGCFFDDAVHEILGFQDLKYQTIYHFTVGGFLEDFRLKSYPPYYHLKNI